MNNEWWERGGLVGYLQEWQTKPKWRANLRLSVANAKAKARKAADTLERARAAYHEAIQRIATAEEAYEAARPQVPALAVALQRYVMEGKGAKRTHEEMRAWTDSQEIFDSDSRKDCLAQAVRLGLVCVSDEGFSLERETLMWERLAEGEVLDAHAEDDGA